MNLKEINAEYERIMNSDEPNHNKDVKLASLMTHMEVFHSVPTLRKPEWEKKNKKVIAMYRKLSMSRSEG